MIFLFVLCILNICVIYLFYATKFFSKFVVVVLFLVKHETCFFTDIVMYIYALCRYR